MIRPSTQSIVYAMETKWLLAICRMHSAEKFKMRSCNFFRLKVLIFLMTSSAITFQAHQKCVKFFEEDRF